MSEDHWSVKPEELPAEPANAHRFLSRNPPPNRVQQQQQQSQSQSQQRREERRRASPNERGGGGGGRRSPMVRVTRSGHKVKGRGAIRFRADDDYQRERSITPPHWRREEVSTIYTYQCALGKITLYSLTVTLRPDGFIILRRS